MPRPLRIAVAVALALAAAAATLPARAEPPPDASRAEAVAHFEKGLALYDRGAWAAALAEFLEARRLHPLHNAAYQAGLCLERLARFDEALEQVEDALREIGDAATPRIKEKLQRKVVELRGLVGEIAVDDAEPGATVTVDGLTRGEHPLLAPLRVAAGSHLVRVSRTGFEPFEARVVVAGGRAVRVAARLVPLGPTGRVRIVEQGGRALDVWVDGARVGTAPWEGPLGPGPHTVALRGEGMLGTPPVEVAVAVGRTTLLTLIAEELSAALEVEPEPVNAGVAVDGVSVGRGVWVGRLHPGSHRIEVGAQGFLPAAEEATIGRGERRRVRVVLARDPRSSFARRPARFTLEADVAGALVPLLGGDVAGGCSGTCAKSLGAGGVAVVHGGYELGFGLGFGLTAGYLGAAQSIGGRSARFMVVGEGPGSVSIDEALWLHAGLAGAWAGFSLGVPFPIHLRLGAGALLGSASDTRTAGAASSRIEPTGEANPLRGVYVAPELRVGLAVGRRVEVDAGVAMLAAFLPSAPKWGARHEVIFDGAGGLREYGTFTDETFAGPILAIAPGIGARYAF